jgi:hypothetical protein
LCLFIVRSIEDQVLENAKKLKIMRAPTVHVNETGWQPFVKTKQMLEFRNDIPAETQYPVFKYRSATMLDIFTQFVDISLLV